MVSSARALAVTSTSLALCYLIAASTMAEVFAQTPTRGRVSDVYVSTANGVYVYHAGSSGSLSLVPGSPFPAAGAAVGANQKTFVSLDSSNLHTYSIASNGGIGAQDSQIDTQQYSGSECGSVQEALLDRTGQDVYAQINPYTVEGTGPQACSAMQSFKITSGGALSFLGATEFATETDSGLNTSTTTPLKLTGNDKYGYSASWDHECLVRTWLLNRESTGEITTDDNWQFLSVPSTPSGRWWQTWVMTGDPTNHMAAAMTGVSGIDSPCPDTYYATQLASFTVASDGTLSSTNTPDNMPTPKVSSDVMKISPSGDLLAVAGSSGLQIFHFNGANPITTYSGVLTTAAISDIRWDQNHHLYALSSSTSKLYVYNVTPSSIAAASGSPYSIAATPTGLAVVRVLCSAPSTDGVHICDPVGGSTVASPVLVEASGKVSGSLARMELWVDGVKKYTTNSAQLDTTVSLASGTHRFGVIAVNTAGEKWQNAVDATVK